MLPAVIVKLPEVGVTVNPGVPTVSVNAAELDPPKTPPPAYVAVIVCVPAASEDVVSVATPPLNVPVPRLVEPSRKVTVPAGEPYVDTAGVTVAVNVTAVPVPAEAPLLVSAVVVPTAALITERLLTAEALPL